MDDDSAAGSRPGRGAGGAASGGGHHDDSRTHSRTRSRTDSRDALRLREQVSALMDGEAPPDALGEPWAELSREPEARAAWLRYHQLGDWLRSAELHAAFDEAAFLRRFGERLRDEPVQFAPAAMRGVAAPPWWRATPWAGALGVALAGLATVTLLGVLLPQRSAPWSEPDSAQPSIAQGAAWDSGIGASGAGISALRVGLRGTSIALNGRLALRTQAICVPPAQPRVSSRVRAMP
ncbi:sigma-E factor negative regulatory protein [Thiomonas sp. FB-6]|uniref:sigma-E factor negative regulatory protein n=1 Tax=Thiomonas sp. FB-6 TaxID=1158291 RepID=UPI000382836D|nr:RseA family anti-sigma factor [Thiomonas sp. FB-6]